MGRLPKTARWKRCVPRFTPINALIAQFFYLHGLVFEILRKQFSAHSAHNPKLIVIVRTACQPLVALQRLCLPQFFKLLVSEFVAYSNRRTQTRFKLSIICFVCVYKYFVPYVYLESTSTANWRSRQNGNSLLNDALPMLFDFESNFIIRATCILTGGPDDLSDKNRLCLSELFPR